MQTPLYPFFWLSNFRVAPSAERMSFVCADFGKQTSCFDAFRLKNVISSDLNWTVLFVFARVLFVVYSPTRNR